MLVSMCNIRQRKLCRRSGVTETSWGWTELGLTESSSATAIPLLHILHTKRARNEEWDYVCNYAGPYIQPPSPGTVIHALNTLLSIAPYEPMWQRCPHAVHCIPCDAVNCCLLKVELGAQLLNQLRSTCSVQEDGLVYCSRQESREDARTKDNMI